MKSSVFLDSKVKKEHLIPTQKLTYKQNYRVVVLPKSF